MGHSARFPQQSWGIAHSHNHYIYKYLWNFYIFGFATPGIPTGASRAASLHLSLPPHYGAPRGQRPRVSTQKNARRPPPGDEEDPRAPNSQAARIDPAGHSHYACRYHEDSSSWECGLAMIALASVIASPLCLSLRCRKV